MTSKRIWSRIALTTALAGGLILTVGGTAQADRDYKADCQRRLEADRAKIDHDAQRYGEKSRQVDHDVAKMDSTRQWCKDHKTDWDHDHFDVGIYFRH